MSRVDGLPLVVDSRTAFGSHTRSAHRHSAGRRLRSRASASRWGRALRRSAAPREAATPLSPRKLKWDGEPLRHTQRAAQGFRHPRGFIGTAQVFASGVCLGRGDEAERVEYVRGAMLVGRRAHLSIEAEDLILQRLKCLEDFIDAGVETARAGLELFAWCVVIQPHVLRGADERSTADGGADEQRQAEFDRRGDAESRPRCAARNPGLRSRHIAAQ